MRVAERVISKRHAAGEVRRRIRPRAAPARRKLSDNEIWESETLPGEN
jgi:hypothetical protein